MDVKAAGRRVEVQKGSQAVVDWTLERWEGVLKSKKGSRSAADWTLKWRESVLKSKMEAEPRRIVPHKILVNKYSACYNMQAYFVYTVKTKRLKCRNTQSGRNERCYL